MDRRYTYDDVLLKPLYSTVRSRREVDLSTNLGESICLDLPIISANMDTVTDVEMMLAMGGLGGLGIMHRFMSIEDQVRKVREFNKQAQLLEVNYCVVSVGANGDFEDRFKALYETRQIDGVTIDVAHGHSIYMQGALSTIRRMIERAQNPIPIIAGNVATYDGAMDLMKWGADVIKVGVGPGSLCTTRVKTGIGVPQLSAIQACRAAVKEFNSDLPEGRCAVTMVADGGIREPGDAVKALAAGANAVMLGGMLAGCDETPGEVVEMQPAFRDIHQTLRPAVMGKKYRGSASMDAQKDWKDVSYDEVSAEGEVKIVACKGPVANIVNGMRNGIRSGCSYLNARNLNELRKNSLHRFVAVTPLGFGENVAHHKGK